MIDLPCLTSMSVCDGSVSLPLAVFLSQADRLYFLSCSSYNDASMVCDPSLSKPIPTQRRHGSHRHEVHSLDSSNTLDRILDPQPHPHTHAAPLALSS